MGFQQLEINKLAPDGTALRKIRALPGRVTVFRSQMEGENDRYRSALEGKIQTDRFSILLDGVAFRPQDHLFVGCGPLDEAPSHETVAAFLGRFGIEQSQIEATLMKYGLGGLAHQQCSGLTSQQWESLRVIAYTSEKNPTKVLVLNDPFVNLPDAFRDKIADRLATFSWESQAIVVVTKLSYRPQSWIENDYIARVQLEKPRQATIGFGGGEFGNAAQMEQLRKELGISTAATSGQKTVGGKAQKGFTDLLASTTEVGSKLPKWLRSPAPLGTAIVITLMFGYTGITIWNSRSQDAQSAIIATEPESKGNNERATTSENDSLKRSVDSANMPSSSKTAPAVSEPVFKRFGEDLQLAWVNAAKGAKIAVSYNANQATAPGSDANSVDTLKTNSPLQPLYDDLVGK